MLPNPIFTRFSARTATVVLVMSLPSHAFANQASVLVDRWMADFTSMGASVASYERAEDGANENDVTIHGVKIEFAIPLPGGEDKVDVKLGVDAVTFEGLTETEKATKPQRSPCRVPPVQTSRFPASILTRPVPARRSLRSPVRKMRQRRLQLRAKLAKRRKALKLPKLQHRMRHLPNR
ncbi:hypothetical protein V6L77_23660 [Pannonibacter sp. Pt2-lr]